MKEEWIERVKDVLIQIQLRDNLEKTIIIKDYDSYIVERKIVLYKAD
jgi:hypothetical protein